MTDNISDLNADDIESISVLKDASTLAVYGSLGANGVIVISTKKGKVKFNFSSYLGTQSAPDEINVSLTPIPVEISLNVRHLFSCPKVKDTNVKESYTYYSLYHSCVLRYSE